MYTLPALAGYIYPNLYLGGRLGVCELLGAIPMRTESGGAPSQSAPSQSMEMGRVSMGEKPVEDYLLAVGDELPIYRRTGLAPPLYGTAAALGLLLKTLNLPSGAIHSLQEVDTLAPIAIGGELRAFSTLERPRQRAGLRFITAACVLESAPGTPVLTGKTTVMVLDAADAHGEPANRQRPSADAHAPSDLPVVSRTITQERLTAYAAASGDDNPLHLDAVFAAGTRFGGIIAHGMLTLAFISEMMAAHLGERWLTSGSLRARFKGAAYLGDQGETWGRAAKPSDNLLVFNVGVRNPSTGEDLVTGTASVKKN